MLTFNQFDKGVYAKIIFLLYFYKERTTALNCTSNKVESFFGSDS